MFITCQSHMWLTFVVALLDSTCAFYKFFQWGALGQEAFTVHIHYTLTELSMNSDLLYCVTFLWQCVKFILTTSRPITLDKCVSFSLLNCWDRLRSFLLNISRGHDQIGQRAVSLLTEQAGAQRMCRCTTDTCITLKAWGKRHILIKSNGYWNTI